MWRNWCRNPWFYLLTEIIPWKKSVVRLKIYWMVASWLAWRECFNIVIIIDIIIIIIIITIIITIIIIVIAIVNQAFRSLRKLMVQIWEKLSLKWNKFHFKFCKTKNLFGNSFREVLVLFAKE